MSQTDQELDRIERSIEIDATAEKVWSLLERPGWWINEHDVEPDPVIRWEDDVTAVVVHEKWGEFRLVRRASEPPRYISWRWIEADDAGTLVEFWVEDRPGGVTLRVVESGLAGLGKDADALRKHYEGNSEGWEMELAAARRFVLGASSAA
ncbi:MAG TPA: ATPase [Nocardioides sp.]|uniref:SRPBCC domain-containing protein n=1 Tax=uncultured Nocardioides sp. TaxID=198441 RepID=UPI000EE79B49|nr:ATPase [uncultured Nocardioides sp.]HCB04053.1 ATPase [Nocardioides sp.]HRI94179.1 ATPase [Nocardioides sp.]HRK44184.1 ATPase [Nocardioides sp.]